MSWKIVAKDVDPSDPIMKKLFDEAIAAAPSGYVKINKEGEIVSEDTVAMLPRHPVTGKCRLCGQEAELTKEHIPPKSSGNKQRHTKLTFDDWMKHHLEADTKSKHTIEQGGIFGYTLCRKCNSLTGKLYGNEYKNWVIRANKMIEGFGSGIAAQLNQLNGPFGEEINFGTKEDGGVRTGALVRQVLSCMCSLSGSWDLAERHSVLRRIILEQSTEALPDSLELGMSIYFGPRVRIQGPQLRVDAKTGIWRWFQEIAFPPFAFLMVVASNSKEPGLGLLINRMTEVHPDIRQNFTGIIELGFGWSPYPGDYRSEAAIIAGRT